MVIDSIFSGQECTLQEILNSREQRVACYTDLQKKNNTKNVVTLCVNMPGKIKNNPASRAFFAAGKELLESIIPTPVFSYSIKENTGSEQYIGTNIDSFELKKLIIKAESSYPWLRMLDIDVVDAQLGHIGRTQIGASPLTCFICGKTAKECCSRASHSALEIKQAITDFYIELLSFRIGKLAYESLIQEALCTPKPGLVDQNNTGSHKDMDLSLFKESASVLHPYFEQMCKFGFQCRPVPELRHLGIDAENAMLKATNNVNTHKGAIFSLGFMVYSYGYCIAKNKEPSPENICNCIKEFTRDFDVEIPSHVKAVRGLGARGQAINGYEIITKIALPFFEQERKETDLNRALSLTLLLILSQNEDSNIISRSNTETLKWAQSSAEKLLSERASNLEIEKLDQQFIEKNISPGGSADLLSATYFLANLPNL